MSEHDELIRMQERWTMTKDYIQAMKSLEGYNECAVYNLLKFMENLEAPADADAKPVKGVE